MLFKIKMFLLSIINYFIREKYLVVCSSKVEDYYWGEDGPEPMERISSWERHLDSWGAYESFMQEFDMVGTEFDWIDSVKSVKKVKADLYRLLATVLYHVGAWRFQFGQRLFYSLMTKTLDDLLIDDLCYKFDQKAWSNFTPLEINLEDDSDDPMHFFDNAGEEGICFEDFK